MAFVDANARCEILKFMLASLYIVTILPIPFLFQIDFNANASFRLYEF